MKENYHEYDKYYINNGSELNAKDDKLIYYETAAGKGDKYAKYKYNWMLEHNELGADLSKDE